MNKITLAQFMLIVLLIVAVLLIATGCRTFSLDNNVEILPNDSMFVTVELRQSPPMYRIVYHKDTRVMYSISDGVLTLLVNPDGTPYIYKG